MTSNKKTSIEKISVVITTFNQENYISQCIESVLMQHGDFELEVIVGDDNSTDNTRRILEKYKKQYPSQIRLLPPIDHLGMQLNLKRCLENCSGNFVAIFDGENYWMIPPILVKVVDTTGAGDAFCAGFLYGALSNKKLFECGRLGNFIASRKITKMGARAGFPTLDELKFFN